MIDENNIPSEKTTEMEESMENICRENSDHFKVGVTPFDLPIVQRQFAPVFDAAVARRHIYKDLLIRLNAEVQKGPLAGHVFFTGVTTAPPGSEFNRQFMFTMTWTCKARNRMKSYSGYFDQLRRKYLLEIDETDALKEHDILNKE